MADQMRNYLHHVMSFLKDHVREVEKVSAMNDTPPSDQNLSYASGITQAIDNELNSYFQH